MGDDKKSPENRISEGITLMLISAGAYLFAYSYELGFALYFNIPKVFIRVSMDTILVYGSAFLGVMMSMLIFTNIVPILYPKNIHPEIAKFLAILMFFAITVLFYAVIFDFSNFAYWKPLVHLSVFFTLIFAFLTFVFPLITRRKTKGYLAKLEAQGDFDRKYNSEHVGGVYNYIAHLFGEKVLVVLVALFLGLLLSKSIGLAEAVKQDEFLVTNTSPEMIVLRVYDGNLICAYFDRKTKEMESSFVVLNLADNADLVLRLEDIGPLITDKTLPLIEITPTLDITKTPLAIATDTATP